MPYKPEKLKNPQCQTGEIFTNSDIEQIYYPNYIELNSRLQTWLIELSEKQEDRRLSEDYITFFQTEKSWHSPDNLHQLEPLYELRNFIEDFVFQKLGSTLRIFSMWSIIGKNGLKGKRHDHLGKVSGVYYVNNGHTDSESVTGHINFYSPDGIKKVEPLAGKLLIFPASLEHHVDAYSGTKQRIVIAFNLE